MPPERDESPDVEGHLPGRSLEDIRRRLEEMQRELDERAPVDPGASDDQPQTQPASEIA